MLHQLSYTLEEVIAVLERNRLEEPISARELNSRFRAPTLCKLARGLPLNYVIGLRHVPQWLLTEAVPDLVR